MSGRADSPHRVLLVDSDGDELAELRARGFGVVPADGVATARRRVR